MVSVKVQKLFVLWSFKALKLEKERYYLLTGFNMWSLFIYVIAQYSPKKSLIPIILCLK